MVLSGCSCLLCVYATGVYTIRGGREGGRTPGLPPPPRGWSVSYRVLPGTRIYLSVAVGCWVFKKPPAITTQDSRGFPHFLKPNTGIVLQSRPRCCNERPPLGYRLRGYTQALHQHILPAKGIQNIVAVMCRPDPETFFASHGRSESVSREIVQTEGETVGMELT
jgi:hypothetical protein